MLKKVIGGVFILLTTSCSVTPGDAALRGGHYQQAAELYEAGAMQGDALAAQKLAHLYNLKPGLQQDHEKAVYWYKKAIELGDVSSNWFIGVIYRNGEGNVQKDYGLAESYFLHGAELGQHYSMYDLAAMYSANLIRVPNDIEGLKWLNIVTSFASTCATTNEGCKYILRDPEKVRQALESRMSPDQVHEAMKVADDWLLKWKERQNKQ